MYARAESATMPEVEVTEEQYEYLESLREEITEELVGPYGHARLADAMQYLIDTHDGDVDPAMVDGGASAVEFDDEPAGSEDAGDDDETTSDADESAADAGSDADGSEDSDDDDDSDEAKLNSMMQLLDEYDDVWEKAGNDAGYQVELPDQTTETVKTKDDVRALLFKHYR
jgi:restriction endonuclease